MGYSFYCAVSFFNGLLFCARVLAFCLKNTRSLSGRIKSIRALLASDRLSCQVLQGMNDTVEQCTQHRNAAEDYVRGRVHFHMSPQVVYDWNKNRSFPGY